MKRLGVSSLLVAKSTRGRQDMTGKLLRFSLFALLRPSFFPTFWFYIDSFFIFLFFYHSLSFYHHRIILWFLICFLVVDSSFTKRRGIINFVLSSFPKVFFSSRSFLFVYVSVYLLICLLFVCCLFICLWFTYANEMGTFNILIITLVNKLVVQWNFLFLIWWNTNRDFLRLNSSFLSFLILKSEVCPLIVEK